MERGGFRRTVGVLGLFLFFFLFSANGYGLVPAAVGLRGPPAGRTVAAGRCGRRATGTRGDWPDEGGGGLDQGGIRDMDGGWRRPGTRLSAIRLGPVVGTGRWILRSGASSMFNVRAGNLTSAGSW